MSWNEDSFRITDPLWGPLMRSLDILSAWTHSRVSVICETMTLMRRHCNLLLKTIMLLYINPLSLYMRSNYAILHTIIHTAYGISLKFRDVPVIFLCLYTGNWNNLLMYLRSNSFIFRVFWSFFNIVPKRLVICLWLSLYFDNTIEYRMTVASQTCKPSPHTYTNTWY